MKERLGTESVLMVTLTLRHRSQPLRHQVDRLLTAFRTLRARRMWRDTISGGVGFVEVKWSPDRDDWHPHVHALCIGSYLANATLREHWRQITGDSFVVDVRQIRSLEEVARYVVKYATKPLDLALYRNERRLHEAILALQGRHLAMTFGVCRGWKLTATGDEGDWEPIGTLHSLRERGLLGDPEAQFVLDALNRAKSIDVEPDIPP